ncbi:hypothetical protein AMJ52_03395 [candidate division TA06 bacterium DG_78]|uniref:Right handed beta helix domain-containing protein n=1 Tax=candidate division TA06 bacterium DG_78 TaxID=1703772 RepID=A0A0S7YG92_UNCT6|nr:MAG: hypothetical protein AMJ52_03395 [candidate division TA06 bacterium DG_78]
MKKRCGKVSRTSYEGWSYRENRVTFVVLLLLIIVPVYLNGTTYTVINTNDTGAGSLRWAITQANNNSGPDIIDFNIPGAGPHTIFPLSPLPILWDSAGVFIDGLSEPGASTGANPPSTATLMIVVDGINAGAAHGFWIFNNFTAHNNIIQGLVINNFQQDGIRIQATPYGTFLNTVFCNFIGIGQSGMIPHGNGTNQGQLWAGVNIVCVPETLGLAFDNMVDGNLISDNYAEGVGIASCPPGDVYQNTVFNNYIGTDITGTTDFGNVHDGVYIGEGAHDNIVDGNLISGNDFEGVCIVGYAEIGIYTNSNIVFNNIIGLDIALAPLGNTMDGVSIGQYGNSYQGGFAEHNVIDSNTIAYNGNNGVTVWEQQFYNNFNADHNQIIRNAIYDNTLLGIDLGDNGVTANDGGDPDTGPNDGCNFPIITSANYSGGQTTISGTIDIDTDPTQAIVEIFRARIDPSGYGEGAVYLGFATPDGGGNWSTIVTGLSPGDTVTATTTDLNFNTSEFCNNVVVIDVGIEEDTGGKPVRYDLNQNVPNPFSNTTDIRYQISACPALQGEDGDNSKASLKIYNVIGRLIRQWDDATIKLSDHIIWDGTDNLGREVQPGVYFYRLEIDDFNVTKKMIVTR